MAKVIDITERLDFEESPKLKIRDIEVSVNDDAPTMLKIMGKLGGKVNPTDVVEMYELLISKEDREKIDGMKLNFKNFQTVVEAAISVVTETDLDDTGEENAE